MPRSPKPYVDLNKIDHGAMFKGSKGFLIADFDSRMLLPFGDNADLTYYKPRTPETVLPPLGHFQKQWIDACKDPSLKTACDFEYSGNMIEQMLLGLVAYRVGKKLDYDGATGHVTNCPEANDLLEPQVPRRLDAGRLIPELTSSSPAARLGRTSRWSGRRTVRASRRRGGDRGCRGHRARSGGFRGRASISSTARCGCA